MIFHEQFWLLLSKKSPKKFIEIELLYSVLRILLDPIKIPIKITAQLIDQYLEKIETHFNNQSNYEEKIKLWTSEDIVKHFKKLNLNNIAYMKIGYLKPKKFDEFQEKSKNYSFAPQINPTSLYLESQNTLKFLQIHPLDDEKEDETKDDLTKSQTAQKSKRNFSLNPELSLNKSIEMRSEFLSPNQRYKLLYKKQALYKKELEQKRKKKQEEIESECTFVPNGRKNKVNKEELVNRLYSVIPVFEKDEISIRNKEEKEKRELDLCTFAPNINKEYIKTIKENNELPKDYKKVIGRLRNGYDAMKKKKEALSKISYGENYQKLKKENVKPFSFLNDDSRNKKTKPFVYIDVNVGLGKTGRIGLHENDNPKEVAFNFSRAFQLNVEMRQSLEELLEGQLQNFIKTQEDVLN